MAIRPYLAFAGNCREAFTYYQEVLGGELTMLTSSDAPSDAGPAPDAVKPDAVMHAALVTSDTILFGADDFSGSFDGRVHGMCVSCSLPDPDEAARVFGALSEGGEVQMPIGATFFSPAFGMCIDRFGIPWMVLADQDDQ